MGDGEKKSVSYSYCPSSCPPRLSAHNAWKSDMYIPLELNKPAEGRAYSVKDSNVKDSCGEYYKRYEHDEIPVKDFITSSGHVGTGDSERVSITNSLLDRWGYKIHKKVSQELQTNGSSITSLDSHIKFFKTTVQEIFDTFYTSMDDFELYKKKYQEILEKNKVDNLSEMEEFIKDMIQHIVSSDASTESLKSNGTYDIKDQGVKASVNSEEEAFVDFSNESFVEAYKNNKYNGDNTTDDTVSTSQKRSVKMGEVYNIYLVSSAPSVEIKVNDRMLSELNIKEQTKDVKNKVMSADNFKKVAAKKKEIAEHRNHNIESSQDREIPIKISSPKKNLYLNEDFHNEYENNEKSLISRLCNYLCKRFRKNT